MSFEFLPVEDDAERDARDASRWRWLRPYMALREEWISRVRASGGGFQGQCHFIAVDVAFYGMPPSVEVAVDRQIRSAA